MLAASSLTTTTAAFSPFFGVALGSITRASSTGQRSSRNSVCFQRYAGSFGLNRGRIDPGRASRNMWSP